MYNLLFFSLIFSLPLSLSLSRSRSRCFFFSQLKWDFFCLLIVWEFVAVSPEDLQDPLTVDEAW